MKSRIWRLGSIFMIALFMIVFAAACGNQANDEGDTVNENVQNENNEEELVNSWDKPPEMEIDPSKQYLAKVHTSKGEFTIELFAEHAPITVNNFVFLSNARYYEDIVFHRIMETFMIQTGDPTGTGGGGPGYRFEDELNSPHNYEKGIVAMANAGPNTNGSQFFICTGEDCESLNFQPNYTIFGQVSEGIETVDAIAATPVTLSASGESSRPLEEVRIERIEIIEQ